MRIATILATITAIPLVFAQAQAAILYTNPPGLGDDQNGNCVALGCFENSNQYDAQRFTLTTGATVEALGTNVILIDTSAGSIVTMDWWILDDDGVDGRPGTVLYSGSATPVGSAGPTGAVWETWNYYFTISDAELTAGDYYLALRGSGAIPYTEFLSVGLAGAGAASTDDNGVTWENFGHGSDNPSWSILVEGTAHDAPEPATLAVFGLGLTTLVGLRRRRVAGDRSR